jgi:transketolase N-terminal domain/subunit
LSYLRDSHPDRAADRNFIASRGDAAAEVYSAAIKEGYTHDEADKIAAQTLYAGLHVSPLPLSKKSLPTTSTRF